jgi:hypothetical protein
MAVRSPGLAEQLFLESDAYLLEQAPKSRPVIVRLQVGG